MARTTPAIGRQIAKRNRELRRVRHAYARKVAMQARVMLLAAQRLRKIEEAMANEARAIAGEDYEQDHIVTFDGDGSIHNQLEWLGSEELVAGIADIERKARLIVDDAEAIAGETDPPRLPSEKEGEGGWSSSEEEKEEKEND